MFILKNIKAIIMVIFVIISEVIINSCKITHHATSEVIITWGDMLYYFFAQIGYISFLPALFLYWNENNSDSKGIYLGLVVWNVLEILQEINGLLKLNIEFLVKTDSYKSDILQIIFIIFTVLLMYYAHKRWNTSHRYL